LVLVLVLVLVFDFAVLLLLLLVKDNVELDRLSPRESSEPLVPAAAAAASLGDPNECHVEPSSPPPPPPPRCRLGNLACSAWTRVVVVVAVAVLLLSLTDDCLRLGTALRF
jgi:hypothetical protein